MVKTKIFPCVLLFLLLNIHAIADDNLASTAQVTATSEFNEQYEAKFAADGVIPDEASLTADLSHAWCVRGETAQDTADFVMTWDEPVEVGQIMYFGRTSWYLNECWKDWELLLDDHTQPVAHGTLAMKSGPQPITFPKATVRKITLRFRNSYGGFNPGAAEIMVFTEPRNAAQLKKLSRQGPDYESKPIPDKLQEFIQKQLTASPNDVTLATASRQLADWQKNPTADDDNATDTFNAIKRDVLLRDVDYIVVIKRHEIDASHVYTYHYEGFRPGGGLYRYDVNKPDAEPLELVATPTGQILDLDISHDGQTVLFSWRQTEAEPYHLWAIQVDGTGLTQLTNGPWHDYNACWLPDGDIAFLSSRSPQFAYCWHAPVGILYRMAPDGSRLVQLSANYLNDFTPSVLDDGRIIYSRWEYVDRPAIPIQSLWTIHPDGRNMQAYFGNRVLSPGTFMEARQIPETTKVVCTMTGHNGPTRGAIAVLDRNYGMNEQAAIENITPDVEVPRVDEGDGNFWSSKQYSTPYPLDQDRLLLSARGPLLVRTFATDPKTGPDCQAVVLPAPEDGMQYLSAQPVRSRDVPPKLAGPYPDTSLPATIFLKDVYEGLGPDVNRGDVTAIRIVREMQKTVRIDPGYRAFGFQFPVISCGATYAGKMVLGDIPVDDDGSAYFYVGSGMTRNTGSYGRWAEDIQDKDRPELTPATGPIYFIALDNEGRAIQRMRSFTHLMPGEQQTCIGCHDNRRQSPDATGHLGDAMSQREPLTPQLPDWATPEADRAEFAPGFDYVRTIQPIWEQYCVECHNAHDAPNKVDLSGDYTEYFNVSYDVLASENQGPKGSPYVSWIPTYNGQEQNILNIVPKAWGSYQSKLAELVRDGHPDADGVKRFEMDDDSLRKIYAWIDLNVPYYASSETAYPEILGSRRMYPQRLDAVLNDVGQRRCAECHDKGNIERRNWVYRTQNQTLYPGELDEGIVPRRIWTRVTEPEKNPFLLAPLALEAGGTGQCGKAVFADTNDPDYQAILRTFSPIQETLVANPRLDMPNSLPAPDVCRITH